MQSIGNLIVKSEDARRDFLLDQSGLLLNATSDWLSGFYNKHCREIASCKNKLNWPLLKKDCKLKGSSAFSHGDRFTKVVSLQTTTVIANDLSLNVGLV